MQSVRNGDFGEDLEIVFFFEIIRRHHIENALLVTYSSSIPTPICCGLSLLKSGQLV